MVRQDLEEIENARALHRKSIPESVIATTPDDPVIAPFHDGRHRRVRRDARHIGSERRGNFAGILGGPVVHVAKIILVCCRKTFRAAADAQRFVADLSGAAPAGKTQRQRAAAREHQHHESRHQHRDGQSPHLHRLIPLVGRYPPPQRPRQSPRGEWWASRQAKNPRLGGSSLACPWSTPLKLRSRTQTPPEDSRPRRQP